MFLKRSFRLVGHCVIRNTGIVSGFVLDGTSLPQGIDALETLKKGSYICCNCLNEDDADSHKTKYYLLWPKPVLL